MSGLDLTTKVKVLTLAPKQTVLRVQSRGLQGTRGPEGPPGTFEDSFRGEWDDKDAAYLQGELFHWSAPPGSESGVYIVRSGFSSASGTTPEDYDTELVIPDGAAGGDGRSAYQVAVDSGFVGTEVEWLATLHGEKGDQGDAGQSAYDVAVANGFIGTEAEWLASLTGPPGSDATVTAENIESALGYVPADQANVDAARQYPPLPAANPAVLYSHPFLGNLMGNRISFSPVSDRLYFVPGYVAEPTRVSKPRLNVNIGGAGAVLRVGLCAWDAAAGAPGSLLVDWGTADCSSPGFKNFSNGSAAVDLVPGQCYAVVQILGGGSATLYYQSLAPVGIRALVETATVANVVAFFEGGQSSQRINGFDNPPALLADISIDSAVNQSGWRTFVYFETVEPAP